jgi:hypothetical protein
MDLKDLLSIVFKAQDRIWALWGVHTTVAVATIGWLISQREKTFKMPHKLASTLGYTIFYVVICLTFYTLYKDLHLVLVDLTNLSSIVQHPKITEGYIGYLLKWQYQERLVIPIVVCSSFYLFILLLIWSNLLITTEKTMK